ncbi:uncharacterized protein LOC121258640 [Juglans microcarpa x Juglans regia]|uniref:uncharacterized protein LOC121258640 n=1 Tax=Juglans microcarpa x Juglans regia TaxID=2249226 RepID=UPI001B7F6AF2|nr:uncharacterized protein LOC121258640 [Juglans microcarpa x Juglans regia]
MENQKVEKLARVTSGQEGSTLPDNTVVKTIEVLSLRIQVMTIQLRIPDWAASIVKYFEIGEMPKDRQEARKIKNREAHYTMIEAVLYQQGHLAPLLICISPEKAQYMLAKIHEGICRNHSGGQTLAGKVTRVGYYWSQPL